VHQAPRPTGGGEETRAIPGAIVGEDPLHPDAPTPKPGDSAAQKRCHAGPRLVERTSA
jgi:hypothetical protein